MLSHGDYRGKFLFVASVLCILTIVAVSVPNRISQVIAQEGGGTITIHSDGNGNSSSSGLSGHSWVEYTPNSGETTTYGTWQGSGVTRNRELGWDSEASRTAQIPETQEQALMDYIDDQAALGPDAWRYLHPCSSFAAEGWELATGEHTSPGWISNPTTLRENIKAANGGQSHGSVGGGTHGGIESKPISGPPSAFLNEITDDRYMIASSAQSRQVVKLGNVIPTRGPENTTAVSTTPVDALALTETIDAAAVDFVDNDSGLVKAVVLGIQTAEHPHGHDYAVCNSYHGYSIDNVAPIPFPDLLPEVTEENPPWFWYVLAQKDEVLEEALTFVIFVNEAQRLFVIDSRWLVDYYPEEFDFDFDYIFSLQVWASSSEEAYKLLQRSIENLANFGGGSWTILFTNTIEPAAPTMLMRRAEHLDNGAQLTVQSWLTETQTVTFYGSWRSYDDWDTSMGFTYEAEVAPGTSTVILPFEKLLDAVIVSNVEGFLSKVYVGSGFWFVFSDKQSIATMTPGECAPLGDASNGGLILAGCAQMSGTITTTYGYVGLVRTLNPNGRPVDVSDYQALTFMAKGDGKSYQVKLETDAVKDYDYYQFVFTPPVGEWRQYLIPLSLFKQQGGWTPVPFTGKDVKSVAWASVGPHCDDSVQLDIDRVAFVNSLVISGTGGPTSTNNIFGPYVITSEINDDVGVVTAALHYSVNGGGFVKVTMSGNGSAFTGQIPGQSMGSEVRYYIEARDADGNTATDPVDAPYTTHRFRVEWYPSLLADNFGDRNPYNLLDGWSGIFKDPKGRGVITPCYESNVLGLSFDVTDHIPEAEWAGYYTELEQADLRPYNSVVFQVKGNHGGEKLRISLNDGFGHEPKIELSEYLPNGITTGRQEIRIPLVAFISIVDWSAMKSFNLLAEESIGSGSGAITVDEISFKPDAWPIQLDNFNDLDNQNGLGLLHDTDLGGGASLDVGYDQTNPYGGAGASLVLTYQVPNGSYAAWHSGLGGLDVSNYDKLSFVVRGASGGENFHVWLVDQAGNYGWVDVISHTTVANTWSSTPVEIPLQDLAAQGVDLTRLNLFKVAFEWSPMHGTVYLDNIRFELPPSPKINAISPTVATNNVSTTLTLTGTNFLMYPTVALGYYPLKNVTWLSSTVLTAAVPPGVVSGIYDVRVIQPNMQSGMLARALTIWGRIYLPVVLRVWD